MNRNIRKKLGLLLFGGIFSLCLGEVALRILLAVLPPPPGAYWQADPDCGYRLQPGGPETSDPADPEYINSLGFRDRERPVEKPDGTFRVLGLGDSFVYGAVPPAQNFLQVAENKLNASGTVNVDIPLLGCPGWSIENELGLLKTLGLEMQPDLVVVNFYVGNDVTGIPVRGTVFRGDLHFNGSSRWWLGALRKSRLFMLVEKTFLVNLRRQWVDRTYESGHDRTVAKESLTAEYILIQSRNIRIYGTGPDHGLDGLWRQAEKQLLEVDQVCREAGLPWFLVLIPGEVQVDEDVRKEVLVRLEINPAECDFDLPQSRLQAFASENGIQLLDLLPAFRGAHDPADRLYIPNNTHWNERGNKLAGEIIADRIRQYR